MSFATWKNNSDKYRGVMASVLTDRNVTELCEAAYKAGQRAGEKKSAVQVVHDSVVKDPVAICTSIAEVRERYAARSEHISNRYRAEGARECAEALQHHQETS